jgi:hypothetical protein
MLLEKSGSIFHEKQVHEVLRPTLSVATMHWASEQRACDVKANFSNGRSIIATQRAFFTRFRIRFSD